MKSLLDFINEEKASSYVKYLNSLKKESTSFEEFKKVMSEEYYIDDIEYDEKENKIEATFNPHNNAEGNDILITIELVPGSKKESFKIEDFDTEDL